MIAARVHSPILDRLTTEARLSVGAAARPDEMAGPVCSTGSPAIDAVLPGGGLAMGAVHEWCAAGESWNERARFAPPVGILTALAAQAAAQTPGGLIVWVALRPAWWALDAAGILDQSIFVEPSSPGELLWTLDQSLRSPAVAAVVGCADRLNLAATRRLQLAAEHGREHGAGALGLIARPPARLAALSAAQTRWSVAPEPGGDVPRWRLRLHRCKGAGLIDPQQHQWTVTQRWSAEHGSLAPASSSSPVNLEEGGRDEPSPVCLDAHVVERARASESPPHRGVG